MGRRLGALQITVLKQLMPVCVSLAFTACGSVNVEISHFLRGTNDFKKSEILTNGPKIADGQSELLVIVHLVNSDGTEVSGHKPTYKVVSGTGLSPSTCTTSNYNGISICLIKSVHPGTKKISVDNINTQLEAELLFTAPAAKPILGLISSAKNQTQGTYSLSASIGNQEPFAVKTSGTLTLYGGVQGEVFSR